MFMKKMKCCLQPMPLSTMASVALLVLRLIVGVAFVTHGWGKMQAPMTWMGPDAPVPGFLQCLAAFSEFAGGIAWIVGLLTSLASLGIFVTMSVAVMMHAMALKDPFVSLTGGRSFELPAAYWAIAILLFTFGAGKISLDAKIFGERK